MVHLYSLNVYPPKAQPSDIAPLDEEFHFLDLRSQRLIRAKFWTFCGPILDSGLLVIICGGKKGKTGLLVFIHLGFKCHKINY